MNSVFVLVTMLTIFSVILIENAFAEEEILILLENNVRKVYYTGENIISVLANPEFSSVIFETGENAKLEIKAPRVYKIGPDLFTLRNGEEVEGVKEKDECFFYATFETQEPEKIEIIFAAWPEYEELIENCETFLVSPLKQMNLGRSALDIVCKKELELIRKIDGSPACVKPESVSKLVERKWVKPTPSMFRDESEKIQTDFDLSQIKTMKPNSKEFFYYPNPEDTENRDVFQKFILIRLPESLGGAVDDASAFRAYSSVAVTTDHCLVNYWPDEGRQGMENPCWGGKYRAIDGLLIDNIDPVMITSPVALPHLALSKDENGTLYVEPPIWTPQENGVISIGRQISIQEIYQGSEILIDFFEKSHPHYPKIPLKFAGYTLAELNPGKRVESRYFDFNSLSGSIFISIELVSAQDQNYFLNLAKSDSEFWQIDETVIHVGGSALEKNNNQLERHKTYEIQFIKDGFKIAIEGKNLEFMKKEIVTNYFPENEYDDMFLISDPTE